MLSHRHFSKSAAHTLMPALLLGGFTFPSAAQQTQQHEDTQEHLEEIIVSSRSLGETSSIIAQSITVLTSEALERARTSTLGDTLDRIPGLAQASFGPAVSRPVIRGLGGDRIRILTNGIGTIDAASSSPDHATAINLEQAEKIEILKGPATLLFGNNAVGGAINIFDGRIPTKAPQNGFKLYGSGHYGTNADEVSVSSGLTTALTDTILFHTDANYLDRGTLEIPANSLSREFRSAFPSAASEGENGRLSNTFQERYGVSGGLTLLGDAGFIGASLTYFDNEYGLPSRPEIGTEDGSEGDEEEGGEGPISIVQDQIRFDFASDLEKEFLFFQKAKLRFSYADYEHTELEGAGADQEAGTVFSNEGWEGRLELVQKQTGPLNGVVGIQLRDRDFSAVGEEAFIPETNTQQYGVFLLETYDLEPVLLEFGARLEHQDINVASTAGLAADGFDETGISLSTSATWTLGDTWQFSVHGYRTERAPSVEELLSDGPHEATQTFELGDPDLTKETALGFEASLHFSRGSIDASFTYFRTSFDDFIFQQFTGGTEDGLPIASYQAADARFQGFEAEATIEVFDRNKHRFELSFASDYVRATNRDTLSPLPRIAPLSVSGGFTYESPWFDLYSNLTITDRQNRESPLELETPGYSDLDVGITVHPYGPQGALHIFVEGSNLLDETIRSASSFLKDFVPSGGANVRIGARFSF